jgi:uncharacterized protein
MQTPDGEPSMEDILASIKKVIAEEKELRTSVTASPAREAEEPQQVEEDVLELSDELAPAVDLGPPLLDEDVAETSRHSLETLATITASVPAAPLVNPLEEMVREMLKPILKQWLDDNLPGIVDEHVKREISRITGRPL